MAKLYPTDATRKNMAIKFSEYFKKQTPLTGDVEAEHIVSFAIATKAYNSMNNLSLGSPYPQSPKDSGLIKIKDISTEIVMLDTSTYDSDPIQKRYAPFKNRLFFHNPLPQNDFRSVLNYAFNNYIDPDQNEILLHVTQGSSLRDILFVRKYSYFLDSTKYESFEVIMKYQYLNSEITINNEEDQKALFISKFEVTF